MFSQFPGLCAQLDTVQRTGDLNNGFRTVISGYDTRFVIDQTIKDILLQGGANKSRSRLADNLEYLTEIQTPRVIADDEVYVRSVAGLVNRYLDKIDQDKNHNKILAILVKLFACNVGGFYGILNLSPKYRELVESVLGRLSRAESRLVTLFEMIIDSKEYLLDKLPARFEYTRPKTMEMYEQYLTDDFERREISDVSIQEYTSSVNLSEFDDIDNVQATIETIPDVLRDIGFRNVLRSRTDYVMNQKFQNIRKLDTKVYDNLYNIIQSFRHIFLQLTGQIELVIYQNLFGIAGTTYKDNRNKVVKEIAAIADQEEFIKFKEILLES